MCRWAEQIFYILLRKHLVGILLLSPDILDVKILDICQVTHQRSRKPTRWIGVTWTSSASDSMVTFLLLHSQRRTLESHLSESLSQILLAEEAHQVRVSFTNASEEQLQGLVPFPLHYLQQGLVPLLPCLLLLHCLLLTLSEDLGVLKIVQDPVQVPYPGLQLPAVILHKGCAWTEGRIAGSEDSSVTEFWTS